MKHELILVHLCQPIARFQGQATDIDLARKEIKNVKDELVKILASFFLNRRVFPFFLSVLVLYDIV